MANEEHLAKLKEGVEIWNKWRGENSSINPDLEGMSICFDDLCGARLSGVNLQNAQLQFKDLQNSTLVAARLQGASMIETQLQGAKLIRAKLRGADLNRANLANADIRRVAGIRLNDTNIRNIRVDLRFGKPLERFWNPRFIKKPRAIPWIELRRAYTGVNFLITLVALLAFLFPYVLQAGYLQALNWFQVTLVETTPILKESLESANQTTPLDNSAVPFVNYLENLTPCFAPECRDYRIILLLLGFDQGLGFFLFNILLVIYNVSRFLVTREINVLRDEEEQGGWSPKKSVVDRFIVAHIVLQILLLFVVVFGICNAVTILFKIVQVPA